MGTCGSTPVPLSPKFDALLIAQPNSFDRATANKADTKAEQRATEKQAAEKRAAGQGVSAAAASEALEHDFTCPISGEVMEDPVIAADGHTYERAMISEWFRVRQTSPLTNAPLDSTAVIPNITLKKVIADWRAARHAIPSSPPPLASAPPLSGLSASDHDQYHDDPSPGMTSPHLTESIGAKEIEQVKSMVYSNYSSSDEILLVRRVAKVQNPALTASFKRCQQKIGGKVARLFHGTLGQSAASIADEGFRVPLEFERADSLQETGQLTFGKAVYFSKRADLACSFGEATLIIADVALGRVWHAEQSLPALDYGRMRMEGKDSVAFGRTQEHACYATEQAVPLYIVTYTLVDPDDIKTRYDRSTLEATYDRMVSAKTIDWDMCLQHIGRAGRVRQRHAALRKLGDCCRDDQKAVCARLPETLLRALREQCLTIEAAENDAPATWLALRLCWNAAYCHQPTQRLLVTKLHASTFVELLGHWNNDVVDRAAGVILNLSQLSKTARTAFWETGAPMALARLVAKNADGLLEEPTRGGAGVEPVPHCLGAIANLAFAADTRSKFLNSTELREFLTEVAEPLMDSWHGEVREEATRVFSCIIAGGKAPAEWLKEGGAEVFEKSVGLED
mmetsp:Transcript_12021/g.21352  ORF Transcript_12021/g.21352 Transcript_12021/m.21352 type:complete len:624 (+) Transcript_12021:51-1922(+)